MRKIFSPRQEAHARILIGFNPVPIELELTIVGIPVAVQGIAVRRHAPICAAHPISERISQYTHVMVVPALHGRVQEFLKGTPLTYCSSVTSKISTDVYHLRTNYQILAWFL